MRTIRRRVRKAAFMPLEQPKTKRFKYLMVYYNLYKQKFILIWRKVKNQTKTIINNVAWFNILNDIGIWLLEAIIEGVAVNYVTWALFGDKFTPITIIAYGITIKETISIFWRLRRHGEHTKVHIK